MNPVVKQKWLDALRDGSYKQTRGTLQSQHEHFCCLGVLCDLAIKSGVDVEVLQPVGFEAWGSGDTRADADEITYDGIFEVLPPSVMKWAGLNDPNPDVNVSDIEGDVCNSNLADYNDSGASFEEVAKVIEANL
jgi:hypothetical protein